MSFFDHLRELRKRLFRAFLGLIVGFGVCYWYAKDLFRLLRIPFDAAYMNVHGVEPFLIVKSVLESFVVYLKVGILGGIFLSSPFIFLQVWGFISPALRPEEKKHVVPFVVLATLFFLSGAFFGYYLVFPKSFEFFLTLTKGEHIETMIGMEDYYKFASWMLLGFGLIFEVPLIVIYLIYFGFIGTAHLIQYWRGIIVGILVASAIITPTPDFATMIMMALPLFFFYGVVLLLSLLPGFRRNRRAAVSDED